MFALVASSIDSWDLRQGQKLPTVQQPLGRCRTNFWEAAFAQFKQAVWKAEQNTWQNVSWCQTAPWISKAAELQFTIYANLAMAACTELSKAKWADKGSSRTRTIRSRSQVAQCHGRSPAPWWPSSVRNLTTNETWLNLIKPDETWWNQLKS